jgi:hypothetical protein
VSYEMTQKEQETESEEWARKYPAEGPWTKLILEAGSESFVLLQ